jgi:pimeloyl-ACP methyl ester carboxylesterase
MRTRRLALALAAVALTAGCVVAPAAVAAPRLTPCRGERDFGCGTLPVPLDHSGRVPGQIAIHFAAQRRFPQGAGLLIALSGGPGQPSVDAASSFAVTLQPALARYRLVVLDQRGTGRSGALNCPSVQGLRSLDPFLPPALAACAARIGPRRAFYATSDTVQDLDALRAALGAPKVALMGISYGTHVALQYARTFPDRVDRLILDSIVGPDGPDPFLLDTYRNLPRILREQCAADRCRIITKDPVDDVAVLAQRLRAGPLQGHAFDARGRRVRVTYHYPDELSFLITAGDLNPFLQAELPAAIAAARTGDRSLLMRLRRIGQGPREKLRELSFGLNVTTGCLDTPLPYSLQTPIPARPAIAQQALAAIPPAEYTPFDGQTVLRTSYVDDCLQWPADTPAPPATGPLPDVPALLLGGRLDTRTPFENAEATARELPHATLVPVHGTGHDTLDSDVTGCTARALALFVRDLAVGTPCKGHSNEIRPLPLPPRSLLDFRSAPGVGGERGRVLFAALDTAEDARLSALQALFAGLQVRGGGLHGGWFTGGDAIEGTIRVHRYSYLAGVRITGTLRASGRELRGRLSVLSRRMSGTLRLDGHGGAAGRLGGRAVRYRPARGRAASVAGRRVDGPGLALPRRLPGLTPLAQP